MKFDRLSRREVFEKCIVRGLLVSSIPLSQARLLAWWQEGERLAAKPTPAEVLGPFYKKLAPDTPNLRAPGDPGFPLRVTGKVMNTRGDKVEGAKVEIWQADHHGSYDVKGYRYRAALKPDAKGEYACDTVMPGHYSDRPAQHIHYLITAPGHKPLVTQVYFATDPFFDGDPDKNYAKNGIVRNRDLVRPVRLYEGPEAPHAAVTMDIVLERA
jgi:protocatechuate 3,4-dioxygenase beta subunit